jgi:hypothetical protein
MEFAPAEPEILSDELSSPTHAPPQTGDMSRVMPTVPLI